MANKFTVWGFFNSPDVAYCCKQSAEFNAIHAALIIKNSLNRSVAEQREGYRWVIDNMDNIQIPDDLRNIPFGACPGVRRQADGKLYNKTVTYKGMPVHDYIRCLISGEFPEFTWEQTSDKDKWNPIEGYYYNVPHPFRVGDVVTDKSTGTVWTIDTVDKLWVLGTHPNLVQDSSYDPATRKVPVLTCIR